MNWERIDDYTKRAKVFGGWLVLSLEEASTTMENGDVKWNQEWRPAMAFVPDKMHQWKI